MIRKTLFVLIVLLCLLCLVVILIISNKRKTIDSIKSMHIHYTVGYAMNADVKYDLSCKDECILKYKLNGVSEEDAKTIKLSEEDVFRIINVLNKYNVYKWDGFDKTNKNVLDGDSFSFSLNMKNGDSISAFGYMRWPKHYREVINELEVIFKEVIN